MHEYGYNGSSQYSDYLELDDNMNFAIQATDSECLIYYLVVYTDAGITTILEYGPLSQEDDIVPEESMIKWDRIESSENAIDKRINEFLRPRKKLESHKSPFTSGRSKIIEVVKMSQKEALDYGINLFNMLKVEMGIKIEKEENN